MRHLSHMLEILTVMLSAILHHRTNTILDLKALNVTSEQMVGFSVANIETVSERILLH